MMKRYLKLSVVAVLGLSMVVGCDVPYDAEFCNTFNEPVNIIYNTRAVSQTRMIPIASGTCSSRSDAVPMPERVQLLIRNLPEGPVVLTNDDRVLARFAAGTLHEGPTLHAPLRLMIADDGIFLVPYEFQTTWFQNTCKVKEQARRSWPNLATRSATMGSS